MNAKELIVSLIVSAVLAVVAVTLHQFTEHETFDGLAFVAQPALLFEFGIAVFAGHLLIRLAENVASDSTDMETGTVKWFNVKKGYGFITRDQGDDVFVHFRNIRGSGHRSISEGKRVRFRVVTGEKGLQADDVQEI